MRHSRPTCSTGGREADGAITHTPGITQGLVVTDGRSSTGFTVVPWAERASGPSSPASVRASVGHTSHRTSRPAHIEHAVRSPTVGEHRLAAFCSCPQAVSPISHASESSDRSASCGTCWVGVERSWREWRFRGHHYASGAVCNLGGRALKCTRCGCRCSHADMR